MIQILLFSLLAINCLEFILFGIDKYKAKHAQWRIPEVSLLLIAIVGGSIGGIVGMKVWRHKTKHAKFFLGLPAILICQCVLAFFLCLE